jgi:hypothetical protein
MASSHGGKKMWCVPKLDAVYESRMRDVLRVYRRPHNPRQPVICLDEKSVELREDKRVGGITSKGIRLRDHEYIRRGTANIFVLTCPKGGKHYARVTQRRTAVDFARTLQWLARRFVDAEKIHLVMDNLNTHKKKSLTDTFGKKKGERLWRRFHVHLTPVHASWLNQAEIAINVMMRSAVGNHRISNIATLRQQVVGFWAKKRAAAWTMDWKFTNRKASIWLKTF